MKLFPEFGSCWGGAIVSPATEAAGGGRQTEEQETYRHTHAHRKSKKLAKVRPSGGSITPWKPKLNAISEDGPTAEVKSGGVNRHAAGIGEKKQPVKVKPKSPAKAAPPLYHEEEYWKSSQAMALPAFSPTSFLF